MKAGIWPPYEAFYIEAMLFHTNSAMASIGWVRGALEAVASDPYQGVEQLDQQQMLDELQNVVLRAAALSRFFWPAAKQPIHQSRGARLRNAMDVDETNPLFDRNLRNAIEHFDERLDLYVADGIVGNIFPEYVGPLLESTDVPVHIFRAYYVDTGLFEMLGNRYPIMPVANEVMRVHQRLLDSAPRVRLIARSDDRSEG